MNHDSAVAVALRAVVLIAAAAAAGCSSASPRGTCNDPMKFSASVAALHQRVNAESPDGGVDDLVARCQADAGDCLALCQFALEPNPYVYSYVTCELVPTEGGLLVHVVYTGGCGL